MAQVLPVVGLALVLEVRSIVGARRERGRDVPAGLAVLWATVGAGLAIGLSTALGVLRRDDPPVPWFAASVEVLLGAGLTVVVVNPVIYAFLAGGARWVAALWFSPRDLAVAIRVRWRMNRILKKLGANRAWAYDYAGRARQRLRRVTALLEALPASPSTEEERQRRAEALELRDDILEDLDESTRQWREVIVLERNMTTYLNYLREVTKSAVRDSRRRERAEIQKLLTSLDTLGLFDAEPPSKTPPMSDLPNPDDGGFFGPDAVGLPAPEEQSELLDYEDKPYIVRTIEDFRRPGDSLSQQL